MFKFSKNRLALAIAFLTGVLAQWAGSLEGWYEGGVRGLAIVGVIAAIELASKSERKELA